MYTQGIKKEKNNSIQLWSVLLFPLLLWASFFGFLGGDYNYLLDSRIISEIVMGQDQEVEDIELQYNEDKKYFLAEVEWEKDWWEELNVGRLTDEKIEWISINKPPGEQAILSAKFIDLKGFNNPLVEVYGLTHAGHGSLYIYEIQNHVVKLLFEIKAVDFNPDTRWAPDNFKKYEHGTCGEIFSDGKLVSEYKDVNNDGMADIILSGKQEIICESDDTYEIDNNFKPAGIPINKIFLWDKIERTWVEKIL